MPEETIKPEVIEKTQKLLGKYVKKPPLTEKLLKKPPFRFLHDIINVIIKDTRFLHGLFTTSELNSENVKERDAKLAFLAKLIDAVKSITKIDLAARPSKIVAGLEPEHTNLLLQAIATAIDKKLDSSEYVKKVQTGIGKDKALKAPKKDKKPAATNEKDKKSVSKSKDEKRTTVRAASKDSNKLATPSETPKSTNRSKDTKTKQSPRDKSKVKKKTSSSTIELEQQQPEIKAPTPKPISPTPPPEIPPTPQPIASEIQEAPPSPVEPPPAEPKKRIPSASRPKSARPKSGELKEQIEPTLPASFRPKTSLRPPSVRPSSARPGAPRLRPDSAIPTQEVVPMGKINVIVENFDKSNTQEEDEETVVIQNSAEIAEEQAETLVDVAGDNKGHLVEQILEQINSSSEGDGLTSRKIDIDWQKDDVQGNVSKETSNLRNVIQNLTKTANPLGKLLNYLHEDVDAMHSELEQWSSTKKQLFDEIAKQKKIAEEMNKPLITQLDNLRGEINKYESEIVGTRSNILRNDMRINELLAK